MPASPAAPHALDGATSVHRVVHGHACGDDGDGIDQPDRNQYPAHRDRRFLPPSGALTLVQDRRPVLARLGRLAVGAWALFLTLAGVYLLAGYARFARRDL